MCFISMFDHFTGDTYLLYMVFLKLQFLTTGNASHTEAAYGLPMTLHRSNYRRSCVRSVLTIRA